MNQNNINSSYESQSLEDSNSKTLNDFEAVKKRGMAVELLPFFTYLRYLGRCPLLFETSKDKDVMKVNYTFKICLSPDFLLSAFAAIFISMCTILQLIHTYAGYSVYGDLWPVSTIDPKQLETWEKVKPMPRYITLSFEIIFNVHMVVEYILIWITSPMLSKWLNNWNEIDNDLTTNFGILYNPNLSRLRKYFCLPYIIIPSIVFGSAVFFMYSDLNNPFGVLITITACYFPTACFQAEDAKVVIMFKAIEKGFKQIKQGVQIRHDKQINFRSKMPSTKNGVQEIRSFTSILLKLRKQSALMGIYLCYPQLISIASLVYFGATTFFVIAYVVGDPAYDPSSLLVLIIFTTITNIRILVKIFRAVRITDEERKVAYLLKDLELLETNLEYKKEIKEMHDMLVYRPTEISLNNYVTLNNSLILGIFSQILTLFVVLIQFQGTAQ